MPFGNVGRVWAMFLAYRDHRMFEMLELLHPDVVWTRPGPVEYRGHDGVRQMLAELQQATGGYSVLLDDVVEDESGMVIAKGRVTAREAHQAIEVTWKVHFTRGLVTAVETLLAD